MLDSNTVINGLGIIRSFFEIGQPSQSAIFDSYQNIIDGAIQLLKEQQNKREVDTPIKPHIVQCNHCKYYEGVRNVMGHAPCSFWNIGGVLYNDFCSRFKREEEQKQKIEVVT